MRSIRSPFRLAPLSLLTGLLFLTLTACGTEPDPTTVAEPVAELSLEERARAIHDRVMTLDTHNDFDLEDFTAERNYTMDLPSQVNLPKMKAGGLDVSWLIVYTGQGELTAEGYDKAYASALESFAAIHRLVEEYAPDQIELALTSEDARRIHAAGKLVAMIGVENGYPIGLDPNRVKEFYDLGARYLSLSHNGHSQLSDSNTGEKEDDWPNDGVSELGREVIAEMNRWGMMIDISHPSKKAMIDMVELSQAPIIASHSAARALCDHSRNLDDEQLLLLKENGGVVQTVAFGSYVSREKTAARRPLILPLLQEVAAEMEIELLPREEAVQLPEAERKAYYNQYRQVIAAAKPRIEAEVDPVAPPVDVADFVDHIDHIVQLIGIDHVGISSDFDGGGGVKGWNDASETFNVTLELVRRGYTEEQIAKLWSGNLLRVLDEVQAVAQEIQQADAA